MLRIQQLFIYPVKSCAAVSVARLELDTWGAVDDRRWMMINADGRFISQRDNPLLARFQPIHRQERWYLRGPSGAEILLSTSGEPIHVSVWKDSGQARDLGDHVATWISGELGIPARIVYADRDFHRLIPETYAATYAQLSFVDAMPLHLTSEESLQDLNSRLVEPLAMERFRPNVVVSGGHPFEEDLWSHLTSGELSLRVAKGCSRCVITTVEPRTGQTMGAEPLKTLAQFRRREGKVFFGQYLIHDRAGALEVGMPLVKNLYV
jgi:uncharacterized protein YcbX